MVKYLLLSAALVALGGCTVGPTYQRPELALPSQFDQAAGLSAASPPSRLWSSFASAELDALIGRAVQANSSLAQAVARLEETRAYSGLSVYSWFPTVTATAGAERSQPSAADPFIPSDQGRSDSYRAGFDAQWEIDLFGNLRQQKRAIYQRLDADAAALDQVRLSVVAEVAQAWFALRGAQLQVQLRQQQVANLQANVDLLQALLDAGRGTAFDLARAQTQQRALAATLPDAEAEVVRQEQRLAVLTAWPIDTLRQHLADTPALPSMPELQTLGTPQDWLLRRPDIRAAERRLAAAYSDVGVETAQYFPILNLLGDFGWTGQSLGALGSGSAQRWSFGPSLTWRFLDVGRVRQNVRAAEARAQGSEAAYRETVLRALEETENVLAGLRAANRSAHELEAAVQAADEAVRLAQLRFDAGASNYLDVLDAQRSQLDLQVQALQSRVRQATALAALYKALAGDFAGLSEASQSEASTSKAPIG